jgi:hypothetical protein
MSKSRERTNDDCTAFDHGRVVSAQRGCICPETAVALKARQQAKNVSKAINRGITPAVNDREPDFVEVHLVITRQKRFKQVERDVDRAAIVQHLAADGLTIGAIAYRLGAWAGTVERLLGVPVPA